MNHSAAALRMRLAIVALVLLLVPSAAVAEVLLFRLYLTDGTSLVTYGEFARVGDEVVFSMVAGGGEAPRLHAATLPARAVDWPKTEAAAASTRQQWYVRTRGEEDFERLSDDVAAVLSAIVVSRDRDRALQLARQARATLAEWPRTHFGYRQQDVREIVAVLDEVIAGLRASGGASDFDLALVASAPEIPLEPLPGMPSTRDQIFQLWRVATLVDRSADRVALLQTLLGLLAEGGSALSSRDAATLRRLATERLALEQRLDARYAELTRQMMADAVRAAARARVADVERVLERIVEQDERLGRQRPEMVQALRASVQAQLAGARRLRLLRDQWAIRRRLYDEYQRRVGAQLVQLVKLQPALEAIRRLEGPPPAALLDLQQRLRAGADRLQRVNPPPDLRAMHELLTGAWRFAENAVSGRYAAARGGSVTAAWQASSSAAGSLLLLARTQQELREFIEPPTLQ